MKCIWLTEDLRCFILSLISSKFPQFNVAGFTSTAIISENPCSYGLSFITWEDEEEPELSEGLYERGLQECNPFNADRFGNGQTQTANIEPLAEESYSISTSPWPQRTADGSG